MSPQGSGQFSFVILAVVSAAKQAQCQNRVRSRFADPSFSLLIPWFSVDVSASVLAWARTCAATRYTVRAAVSGGSPPYSYRLAGSDWQDSPVFAGLAPQATTIYVRYITAEGEFQDSTAIVLEPQPRGLFVIRSILSDPPTDVRPGVVVVSAVDADSRTLTYTIDNDRSFASGEIFNVAPGQHKITVQDTDGCSITKRFSMPEAMQISIGHVNASCASPTGAIKVSVTGGTEPYKFYLDGVAVDAPGGVVPNVGAGPRKIAVSDSSRTMQTLSLQVAVPSFPSIIQSSGYQWSEDPDMPDGTVWVNVTGQSGPYEFSLNGEPFVSSSVFAAALGPNEIQVRDGLGCVESQSFLMKLKLTATLDIPTACRAGPPPLLQVNALGGAGTLYYYYDYDGPLVQNTYSWYPGNHKVIVEDSDDPQQRVAIDFQFPVFPPLKTSSVVGPSDHSNGYVLCNVTKPGFSNTTFLFALINGSTGTQSASQSECNFPNLVYGEYFVAVYDSDGCYNDFAFTVKRRGFEIVSKTDPLCYGDATGLVSLSYSGAWSLPVQLTQIIGTGSIPVTASVVDLTAGVHTFQLSDQAGQTSTISTFLSQPDPLAAYTHSEPILGQPGFLNIWVRGFGGVGGVYNYTLSLAPVDAPPFTISRQTEFNSYTVRAGDVFWQVRDANGCVTRGKLLAAPLAELQLLSSRGWCSDQVPGAFSLSAINGMLPFTFVIENSTASRAPMLTVTNGSVAFATNVSPGDYFVRATDASAQRRTATFRVSIPSNAVLGNVFSQLPYAGQAIGSIFWRATGQGPFSYRITGDRNVTSEDPLINFLREGLYHTEVRSLSTGCLSTDIVDLVEHCPYSRCLTPSTHTFLTFLITLARPYFDSGLPASWCANDGKMPVWFEGGRGPFTVNVLGNSYVFPRGSLVGVIENLAPGVYSGTVLDSSPTPQWAVLSSSEVTRRTAPTLIVQSRSQSRFIAYGALEISFTGAAAASVTIDGAPASLGTITGLSLGSHTIRVTDEYGCVSSATADVMLRDVVAVVENFYTPRCCGGLASVSLQSNPSWEYARQDLEVWQDSNVFTELQHGKLYRFFVREKTDPEDSAEVDYIVPLSSCLKMLAVQHLFRGVGPVAPHRVRAVTSGGVGGISYSLNNAWYFASPDFTVYAGPLTVYARDELFCTVSLTYTVQSAPTAQYSVQPALYGTATGSISVRVTGGYPPYLLRLGDGSPSNSSLFTGLRYGSYRVSFKDSFVDSESSAWVTVPEIAPLEWLQPAYAEIVEEGTGSLRTDVSGGRAPYTWTLNGVTNSSFSVTRTIPEYTLLNSGKYRLTVSDSLGLSLSRDVYVVRTVTSASSYSAQSCTGGVLQYSLTLWSNSITPQEFALSPSLEYLANGTVFAASGPPYIRMRDTITGKVRTVDVQNPYWTYQTALRASYTATPAVAADGVVTVTATGGISPFMYSVDGGAFQASPSITGLLSGQHSVTVRDAYFCEFAFVATVAQSTALRASVASVLDVRCFNTSTGQITMGAPVGGISPYAYSVNGGAYSGSDTFSNLPAAEHNISVKDSAGSPQTFLIKVRVSENSPLVVEWSLGYADSFPGSFLLLATVSGGSPTGGTYAVALNGSRPASTWSPLGNGNLFKLSVRSYGFYSLAFTDGQGCTNTQLVGYFPRHIVSATSNSTSCFGAADGRIAISVSSGGSGNFNYRVRSTDLWSTSPLFSGLVAGDYVVQVVDNGTNYISSATVLVTQPGALSIKATVRRFPDPAGEMSLSTTGGTRPFVFTVFGPYYPYNGPFVTSDTEYFEMYPDTYLVSVVDANGCAANIPGGVVTNWAFTFDVYPTQPGCHGQNGTIIMYPASGLQYALTAPDTLESDVVWEFSNTYSVAPGLYRAWARDFISPPLVQSKLVTIKDIRPVSLHYLSTGAGAGGAATSVVTLYADGDNAPGFDFYFNGVFVDNEPNKTIINGVGVGSYFAEAEDSYGCRGNVTVYVWEQISLNYATEGVSCKGGRDGVISVTPAGGSGSYRYKLIHRGSQTVFQSDANFRNLSAGTYAIYAEDANDEAYSAVVSGIAIVERDLSLSGSFVQYTRATFNGSDGTLNVLADGNFGMAEFKLSSQNDSFWSSSGRFENLPAGPIVIQIRDGGVCPAELTFTVLEEPQVFQSQVVHQTCPGVADGRASFTVEGGSGEYVWYLYKFPEGSYSAPLQSPDLTNLEPGDYNIEVDEADGFWNGMDFTIDPAPALTLDITTLSRGREVLVRASGGNGGPYRFGSGFAAGDGQRYQAPFPISDIVVDGAGCRHRVTITAISDISVDPDMFSVSCVGAGPPVVNATIRAVGGAPPYRFVIGSLPEISISSMPYSLPTTYNGFGSTTLTISDGGPNALGFSTPSIPGYPQALQVEDLRIKGTTSVAAADGSITFRVSPNSRNVLPFITIRNNATNAIAFSGPSERYFSFGALRAASYNIEVRDTSTGCFVNLTGIAVPAPAAPRVKNFDCELIPDNQNIRCIWQTANDERYEFGATLVDPTANSSVDVTGQIPLHYHDLSYGFPKFWYSYGYTYAMKLRISSPGGVTEGVVAVPADVVRPPIPDRASIGFGPNGTRIISWLAVEDPTGSPVTYSVFLSSDTRSLTVPIASNVDGTSAVLTREVGDALPFNFGERYIVVVYSYAVNSGLHSFPASWPQSSPYEHALVPTGVDFSVGFDCELQCTAIATSFNASHFGGGFSLTVEISYAIARGSNVTMEDSEFLPLVPRQRVYSYAPNFYNANYKRFSFAQEIVFRMAIWNAAGSLTTDRYFVWAAAPWPPRLSVQDSFVGLDVSTEVYDLYCSDHHFVGGIQPSQFRTEWVVGFANATVVDWTNTKSTPLLSAGSYHISVNATGGYAVYIRCWAVNPYGETPNAEGIIKRSFRGSLGAPSNLRAAIISRDSGSYSGSGGYTIGVKLDWDWPFPKNELYGYVIRTWGIQCQDRIVDQRTSDISVTHYYMSLWPNCPVRLSVSAWTVRGDTPYSSDYFILPNVAPDAPSRLRISDPLVVLGPTSTVVVSPGMPYQIASSQVIDSVLLEVNSNATGTLNASAWIALGAVVRSKFVTEPDQALLAPFYVPVSLLSAPVQYFFRAYSFNGLQSVSQNSSIVVYGTPRVPANVQATLTFHPTNGNVTFLWDADTLAGVFFEVNVRVAPLSGSPVAETNATLNGTSYFVGNLAAGTQVVLRIRGVTLYRASPVAVSSALMASGTYWTTNTSLIVPTVSAHRGLEVDLSWPAETSPNGFSRTQYTLRTSAGSLNNFVDYPLSIDPVPNGLGRIEARVRAPVTRPTNFFVVVPFNALGRGPESAPSVSIDLYAEPVVAEAMVFTPVVPDNATTHASLLISWDHIPFVTKYRVRLVGELESNGLSYFYDDLPCCSFQANVTRYARLRPYRRVFTEGYGWTPSWGEIGGELLPPAVGAPDQLQILSVDVNSLTSTSGAFDIRVKLARTDQISRGAAVVVSYSVASQSGWLEAAYNLTDLSSTTQTVRLTGSIGICYDIRVLLQTPFGRGDVSQVVTSCIADVPTAILSPSIDESLEAMRRQHSTDGQNFFLPLRFLAQNLRGSNVSQYEVSLLACFRCSRTVQPDWTSPLYSSPYWNSSFAPPEPNYAGFIEANIAVRPGVISRLIVRARNIRGLYSVYQLDFQPQPMIPLTDVTLLTASYYWYGEVWVGMSFRMPYYAMANWRVALDVTGPDSNIIASSRSDYYTESDTSLNLPHPSKTACVFDAPGLSSLATCTAYVRWPDPVYLNSTRVTFIQNTYNSAWRNISVPNSYSFDVPALLSFADLKAGRWMSSAPVLTPYKCYQTAGTSLTVAGDRFQVQLNLPFVASDETRTTFPSATITQSWPFDGTAPMNTSASTRVVVSSQSRLNYVDWTGFGGTSLISVFVTYRKCVVGNTRCYSDVIRIEQNCSAITPPAQPSSVTFERPYLSASSGLCVLPVVVQFTNYSGAGYLAGVGLRGASRDPKRISAAFLRNFERVWSFNEQECQVNGSSSTCLLRVPMQPDLYYSVQGYLRNDAGRDSTIRQSSVVFCRPATLDSLSPYSVALTQGTPDFLMTLSPPLPQGFRDASYAQVRIDGLTLSLVNDRTHLFSAPPRAAGNYSLSFSYDSVFWTDPVPFSYVATPSIPTITAPAFVSVLEAPKEIILSHPNFVYPRSVKCYISDGVFDAVWINNRTAVTCPARIRAPPVPTSIEVLFSIDGIAYSTGRNVTFWDPSLVSLSLSSDTIATRGCSGAENSTMILSVSRWPYVPSQRPIVLTLRHTSFDFPDTLNFTLPWNDSAGAYSIPFPAIPLGKYVIAVTDGTTTAGTTFWTHSSECSAARARCLAISECVDCAENGCSWVFAAKSYGHCVLPNDSTFYNSIGFASGRCPSISMSRLKLVTSTFSVVDAQAIGDYEVEGLVRTDGTPWTGVLNWGCDSPYYPVFGPLSGDLPYSPGNYVFRIRCRILIDPAVVDLGATLRIYVSTEATVGREFTPTVSFYPAFDLEAPEYASSGIPMLPQLFRLKDPVFWVARFTNPIFVRTVRWWVNVANVGGGRRDVAVGNRQAAVGSTRPEFKEVEPIFFDLSVGNTIIQPGRHTITVLMNEGLSSETRRTLPFDVLFMPAILQVVLSQQSIFGQQIIIRTPQCYNQISAFQTCVTLNIDAADSAKIPGLRYSRVIKVVVGFTFNENARKVSRAQESSITKGQEGYRAGANFYFDLDFTGYVYAALQMNFAIQVAEVQKGIAAEAAAEMRLVPSTYGQIGRVDFVAATVVALVDLGLQPPTSLASVRVGAFYVSVYFGVSAGPIFKLCNQAIRYDSNCNFQIADDIWMGFGVIARFNLQLRAGFGVPLLFDAAIFTEGSSTIWGTAAKPIAGAAINVRVCTEVTIVMLIKKTDCFASWNIVSGDPVPTRLFNKRSSDDTAHGWNAIARTNWRQIFVPFDHVQSGASRSKRLIPLASSGVLVSDVLETVRPAAASGVGNSSNLALLAWTGFDNARVVPKGSAIAFTVYNASTESMSDPVFIRSTNDLDANAFVLGLDDGRFLAMFSTLHDLGAVANYDVNSSSKFELAWAVYRPTLQTWTTAQDITTDGQYFDSFASAVSFVDGNSASPTFRSTLVLAVWLRSRDRYDLGTQNKDLMWAAFNPSADTWSAPAVLVGSIGLTSPPTIAVVNRTILVGYVDQLNENVSTVHMIRYDIRSSSWSAPTAVGRNYQFASIVGSAFNQSSWTPADALATHQGEIQIAARDGSSFAVVWTDDQGVMSRVYSISKLDSLFDATSTTHPDVQLIWVGRDVARNLRIKTVADSLSSGVLLSWSYGAVLAPSSWMMFYMQRSSPTWELSPIEAVHTPNTTVFSPTMFSVVSDTAFLVFASRETMAFENTTTFGDTSLAYKRLRLTPLLSMTSVDLTPSVREQQAQLYDVRVRLTNYGILPSPNSTIVAAHGTLATQFSGVASVSRAPATSVRPGFNSDILVNNIPLSSALNGGYIWFSIEESSAPATRVPTFTTQVKSIELGPASAVGSMTVTVSFTNSPLVLFPITDVELYALVPITIWTRTVNTTDALSQIASLNVNSSIVGGRDSRASFVVVVSNVNQRLVATAGAMDEYVKPTTPESLPSTFVTVSAQPNLRVVASSVQLLDPFVGVARYILQVENSGLRDSYDVAVNLTVGSSNQMVSSRFFPVIRALSSYSVELPIYRSIVNLAGVYNFTISASSARSEAVHQQLLVAVGNNQTISDSSDLEPTFADNFASLVSVTLFSKARLALAQSDVAVRAAAPTVYVALRNTASLHAAANVPVTALLVADNLPITTIGQHTVAFLNASSGAVFSISVSATGARLLGDANQLQGARIIVSIPALFSGSSDPLVVDFSLSAALAAAIPTIEPNVLGSPEIQVADSVYVLPGETVNLQVRQLNAGSYGLSLRLIQPGTSGTTLNSGTLSFTAPVNGTGTVTRTALVGLTTAAGAIFSTSPIRFSTNYLDPVYVAPPQAPPQVSPSGAAPQSSNAPSVLGSPVSSGSPGDPSSPIDPLSPGSSVAPSASNLSPSVSNVGGGTGPFGWHVGFFIFFIIFELILLALLVLWYRYRRTDGTLPRAERLRIAAEFWKTLDRSAPDAANSSELTPMMVSTSPRSFDSDTGAHESDDIVASDPQEEQESEESSPPSSETTEPSSPSDESAAQAPESDEYSSSASGSAETAESSS